MRFLIFFSTRCTVTIYAERRSYIFLTFKVLPVIPTTLGARCVSRESFIAPQHSVVVLNISYTSMGEVYGLKHFIFHAPPH